MATRHLPGDKPTSDAADLHAQGVDENQNREATSWAIFLGTVCV